MPPNKQQVLGTCPQCGRELSSWEQVLLSVDRALICKGCWYHILLNIYDDHPPEEPARPPERRYTEE
jgi:hypothetical protein